MNMWALYLLPFLQLVVGAPAAGDSASVKLCQDEHLKGEEDKCWEGKFSTTDSTCIAIPSEIGANFDYLVSDYACSCFDTPDCQGAPLAPEKVKKGAVNGVRCPALPGELE